MVNSMPFIKLATNEEKKIPQYEMYRSQIKWGKA